MKLITVSLSDKCIKDPPCSFCFQQKPTREVMNRIMGREELDYFKHYDIENIIDKKAPDTVCFEYSGYNLRWVEEIKASQKTMTTMLQTITPVLCGYLKNYISAIALSYDTEKVKSPSEWEEKAQMIKYFGIKVSCNYLLQDFKPIPEEILGTADQLNLLVMKPILAPLPFNTVLKVRLMIEQYKSRLPVALDNCLGVQAGYTKKCMRGIDFIHITHHGEIESCCFKDQCYLYTEE